MLCKAVLITFLHYTAGASMHIALKLCRVCRIYNAQLLTLDVTKIWSSCRGIKSRLTQLIWKKNSYEKTCEDLKQVYPREDVTAEVGI